jgi:lipoprotein NlpD
MKLIHALFLISLTGVIAGCANTPHTAPVVDLATTSAGSKSPGEPAIAVRPADEPGFHTVKKGETLVRIASEFGQNYRDLVSWNNLTNPNDIRVDQVLRVLPPAGAPQTGSVSTGSGVDVRPLGAPSSSQPAASAPTAIAPGSVKSSPRGDKRPYSEAALAELQKPDTGAGAPVVAAIRPDVAKPAEKATDKPVDTNPPDDENVDFIWPAEGKIVGTYNDGKKGIDIAGKSGQQVIAAGAGKVMYAGAGIRGYGNLVIVKHTSNLLSAYAHNKTILVKEGQNVAKGEKIAEMGNSDADSVKLHFEIRQQGKPVDPSKFLPSR